MPSDESEDSLAPFDNLPRKQRRRLLVRATLSTLGRVALVVVIYFIIPMDRPMNASTITELVVGALVILIIIGVQIWRITRSDYPTIQAVEALAFTIPLYVFLFATVYYLMDHANVASFGTHLSRIDTMYFSSTVFTTVGFGDITAKSEAARVLATGQMWLDVLILGIVVRLIVNAIKISQKRHALSGSPDTEVPSGEVLDVAN